MENIITNMEYVQLFNVTDPELALDLLTPADSGVLYLEFLASTIEAYNGAAKAIRKISSEPKYSKLTQLYVHLPGTEEDSQPETPVEDFNLANDKTEVGPGSQNISELIILYGPHKTHQAVDTRFDKLLVKGYWAGLIRYMPNITTLKSNGSLERLLCIAETATSVEIRSPVRYCNTNEEMTRAVLDVYRNPVLGDNISVIERTPVEMKEGSNPHEQLNIDATWVYLTNLIQKVGERIRNPPNVG